MIEPNHTRYNLLRWQAQVRLYQVERNLRVRARQQLERSLAEGI